MAYNEKISEIHDLVFHAGLKLALANSEIAYVKDGKYIVEDKKLHEMTFRAQTLCNEICGYIRERCESKYK